jgi:hypothetical protein
MLSRECRNVTKRRRTSWVSMLCRLSYNRHVLVVCRKAAIFTRHCTASFVIRFFILTPTHALISSILVLPSGCATLCARCSTIASASAANTLSQSWKPFICHKRVRHREQNPEIGCHGNQGATQLRADFKDIVTWGTFNGSQTLLRKIFDKCCGDDDNNTLMKGADSLTKMFSSQLFLSLRAGCCLPADALLLFATGLNFGWHQRFDRTCCLHLQGGEITSSSDCTCT